jgi:hypothetical protein
MPDLILSGSPTFNGDSTCTINATGSDRVSCPDVKVVNALQMWIAMRVKPSWSSADASERSFFRFGPNTNDELFIQYGPTAADWACGRDGTGGGVGGGPVHVGSIVHAAGDSLTVIGTWTPSNIGLSINGAAVVVLATNQVSVMTGLTLWDIGQRGYSFTGIIDSDIHWVATGLGTLTNLDVAAIHALGNTDPRKSQFPAAVSFLWTAESATYQTGNLFLSDARLPKKRMVARP